MNDTPDYEKMCVYCEHATPMYDNTYMFCAKSGVVLATHMCKKFIYDPMKRTVRLRPKLNTMSELDEKTE